MPLGEAAWKEAGLLERGKCSKCSNSKCSKCRGEVRAGVPRRDVALTLYPLTTGAFLRPDALNDTNHLQIFVYCNEEVTSHPPPCRPHRGAFALMH